MRAMTAVMIFAIGGMGCATLRSGAGEIRFATHEEAERCARLGLISSRASMGFPTYQEKAMADLRNQAALLGADAIMMISSEMDPVAGSRLRAEALRCGS